MIYLDNAATSFPKPESVYQAMDHFARSQLANPGRAGHRMAVQSEAALDEARHILNQFFHGEAPNRFAFTLNCTDALNMAIKGTLNQGDEVVTSVLEHNSISRPLEALARSGYISLQRVECGPDGLIDPEDVRKAISGQTRMVAVTHASNVLGKVQPISEIGDLLKSTDTLFLLDAAQSAGVIPIDVQELHVDLLGFPGHKSLLGPTGTGGLYVSPKVSLKPWREGGTGGDSSSPTQPEEFPYYLEGGTPNVHGIIGLIEGVKFVEARGLDTIRKHEVDLVEKLVQWADQSPYCETLGHFEPQSHVGTISFVPTAAMAADVGAILDQAYDIAIRPGLHCAPYVHKQLGSFPDGAIRVSPGVFNTADDVQVLCDALDEIFAEVSVA